MSQYFNKQIGEKNVIQLYAESKNSIFNLNDIYETDKN